MSVDFKDGTHPVIPDNEKAYKTTSGESDSGDGQILTTATGARPSFWTRMGVTPESFKQRTLSDKHNQLNKTMKTRHLHMIAIGGSIGAGLFAGSGGALSGGGPAALVICFGIIGIVRDPESPRARNPPVLTLLR